MGLISKEWRIKVGPKIGKCIKYPAEPALSGSAAHFLQVKPKRSWSGSIRFGDAESSPKVYFAKRVLQGWRSVKYPVESGQLGPGLRPARFILAVLDFPPRTQLRSGVEFNWGIPYETGKQINAKYCYIKAKN